MTAVQEVRRTSHDRGPILVVGGHGEVGRRIAAHLGAIGREVVVAARDERACADVARRVGGRPCRLDIGERRSLDAALVERPTVVSCAPRLERALVDAVIDHGAVLVDVSAEEAAIEVALHQQLRARRAGASLVLGAGLQPGIAGVLARAATDDLPSGASLQTTLILSMGDRFGPAAIDHMLVAAAEQRRRSVGRTVDLGPPWGLRRTVAHPFAGVASHVEAGRASTSTSHVAMLPRAVGSSLALMAGAGLMSGLVRIGTPRRLARLVGLLSGRIGDDRAGVAVTACHGSRRVTWRVVGRMESELTAVGVLAALDQLDHVERGVHWAHDVVDPSSFLARVEELGAAVERW